ncbi:hypothetical protein BV20DRAFT_573141 [Pilatotrama ljubarskyi]|nr:hypothetical protein BV20DRAFT_573141 [Pilatotrama ljubarskyi]
MSESAGFGLGFGLGLALGLFRRPWPSCKRQRTEASIPHPPSAFCRVRQGRHSIGLCRPRFGRQCRQARGGDRRHHVARRRTQDAEREHRSLTHDAVRRSNSRTPETAGIRLGPAFASASIFAFASTLRVIFRRTAFPLHTIMM